MAGTYKGGKQAEKSNKEKYGRDFYQRIGAMGGKASRTGGFAAEVRCTNPDCSYIESEPYHLIRQCAGSRGGKNSRR